MANFSLIALLALAVVVAHATARNIPTDHQTTNPNLNALAPSQNLADQKNFISYGGGWGGIGYVGVLPVIGGVGGVGGAGGIGGLGGLGGGIGKVGGIGIGGGIGKVGGIGIGGGLGGIAP
ncbi:glycine-rich protein 5-like [Salvia divinorum]|uniref:Glycine-rich protein 5-like n=1 Tax=Salvia divinorum TaxID=28513 RepID=A0ABD1FZ96_SALDI